MNIYAGPTFLSVTSFSWGFSNPFTLKKYVASLILRKEETDIITQVFSNNLVQVKELLDRNPSLITTTFTGGMVICFKGNRPINHFASNWTLLHISCYMGYENLANLLIARKRELINIRPIMLNSSSTRELSPLQLVAQSVTDSVGYSLVCRLLNAGAQEIDGNGNTISLETLSGKQRIQDEDCVIFLAAQYGKGLILERILETCCKEERDLIPEQLITVCGLPKVIGSLILGYCSYFPNEKTKRLVNLEYMAHGPDNTIYTPLFFSFRSLSEALNSPEKCSETLQGLIRTVQLLLKNGANLNFRSRVKGKVQSIQARFSCIFEKEFFHRLITGSNCSGLLERALKVKT